MSTPEKDSAKKNKSGKQKISIIFKFFLKIYRAMLYTQIFIF